MFLKVSDVWEATGERKECKFTWDLTRNTNLTWNQKFKVSFFVYVYCKKNNFSFLY